MAGVVSSVPPNSNTTSTEAFRPAGPAVMRVSGAVVSSTTDHAYSAGDASVFPAASVAWTANVCGPTSNPVRSTGDVHAANAAASNEHSNVAPASLAENTNVAVVLVVEAAGPERTVVFGAVTSTACTVQL